MIRFTSPETDWVPQAMKGHGDSLVHLFEKYRPGLKAHALRLLGNSDAAKDVIQDTFITAYSRITSLREGALFYPWIRKILQNHCFMALRGEKTAGRLGAESIRDPELEDDIERRLDAGTEVTGLHEALNGLSEELRACVLLRYFCDHNSYEDIASILGLPLGTVRSRLSAARAQMGRLFPHSRPVETRARVESENWNRFYSDIWRGLYDDDRRRAEFLNHMETDLHLRFTSGKTARGRIILEEEIRQDLYHGSRFAPDSIFSSGNITVIEGMTRNSFEYPDRCPPSSIFVAYRESGKIRSFHIYDSHRPISPKRPEGV